MRPESTLAVISIITLLLCLLVLLIYSTVLTSPSPQNASPDDATTAPFSPGPEMTLIKYPNSPGPGPIPYSAADFVVIEDVRDLLASSTLPVYEPDFILVCRDHSISSTQHYGIRVHRSVFWKKSSSGIGECLDRAPKATGFSFGLRPVSILHAIVSYFYTESLYYDIDQLPFSEACFLVYLYTSAVNRGLTSLADAAYSRIRQPQTRIGEKEDIRSVIDRVLYGQIGKRAAGIKRTTEIREAVVEQFALEILTEVDEEDLEQYRRDNRSFGTLILQTTMAAVRQVLLQRGIDLDELD